MTDSPPQTSPQARSAVGWWYLLLLAITNMIWAAQGTAVKVLEKSGGESGPVLGPIAITFVPFYITTLLFIPLLMIQRRRTPDAARPTRADWWKFAVAGIFGQVPAQLGMTWGVVLSLASNAAVLNLLIPVASAILASIMLGERLSRLRIACLLIGLVGVGLMSVSDLENANFSQSSYLTGNLLIVAGCCGSAFYNVYCKGLLARYGELEILIFSYITASLASLPLLAWIEPFNPAVLLQLDLSGWLALAFLALLMYGVSMLLFFYVLQHLPVTVASASLYLVPVFGLMFAVGLLGESLSRLAVAGAAVVLASTVLIMRYDPSA